MGYKKIEKVIKSDLWQLGYFCFFMNIWIASVYFNLNSIGKFKGSKGDIEFLLWTITSTVTLFFAVNCFRKFLNDKKEKNEK